MPVKLLEWKSPYEKIYRNPPTYEHLRVIGYVCYAANVKPHKDKFENRGVKCVLIGYPVNQKGYKLYKWEKKEIFLSRDVVFEEHIFPFKQHVIPSNDQLLPTYPVFETHPLEETVIPNTPLLAPTHIPNPVSNEPVVETNEELVQNNVFATPEPTSYKQVTKHEGWVKAMEEKLTALERNETWTVTSLPACHKPITSKWVFKTKYKPNSIMDRLKARMVFRGFNQQEGLDYKHTFLPVAKLATLRVLITLATDKQWPLHQLISIMPSYMDTLMKKYIWQLNHELTKFLLSLGYVKTQCEEITAVIVYVDDVLITDDGLTGAKPLYFPLPIQLNLSLDKGTPLSDAGVYKRLVGRLLYLTMTRPDISYVVQHLSQTVSAPKDIHMQAAIHLLKYLKGTILKGFLYPVQPHLQMIGFSDADWASCLMTRRSLTGYCILLGHYLVSWKTKKQPTAAFIPTHLQLADVMTKALGQVQHTFLVDKLGLIESPT
nr:hypothetical protein [Tanacetum cinerariifolium]